MKTILNLFNSAEIKLNYFCNQTIQEKFIICFFGALLMMLTAGLTCAVGMVLIELFNNLSAQVGTLSTLATFPLCFYIDTERGTGDRKKKILQVKKLFNDCSMLYFTDICISGGTEIKKSREGMKESRLHSYYGNEEETTIHRITIVRVGSQENMDLLIDGIGDIWSKSILGCEIMGNWATFEKVKEFNEEQKKERKEKENKKSINQNKSI
tara:strand:- start:145 stop:777 length:633 start_codon:yes stop_codon:yes gene_type:complete